MHAEQGEQTLKPAGNRGTQQQRGEQQGKRHTVALQPAPEPGDRERIDHAAIQAGARRLASRRLPATLSAVTLAEKQQQLVADYAIIDDPQERLSAVVDRARSRPSLPEAERSEANRVPGCVSLAWVVSEVRDGLCFFRSDADSPLVRGLLVLLCDFYSDATPAEVLATEPALLEELGLAKNLSPTRLNGLKSAAAYIRAYANSVDHTERSACPP